MRVESDSDTCMTVSIQNNSVSIVAILSTLNVRLMAQISFYSVQFLTSKEIYSFLDTGRQLVEEVGSRYQ